ncbi:hypothetical protein C2U68_00420 [Methylomonas koyamae]|nr:hypothetical protein C2U68_00420 [Methylomonas koyamae]
MITSRPSAASYRASAANSVQQVAANTTQVQLSTGSAGHDESFDVSLAPQANVLPPGTELHVVGVYSGGAADGPKSQPWWAKCPNRKDSQAMLNCHQQYAVQHTQNIVTVTVPSSPIPKVLALMSYEPVKWVLVGAKAGNVRRIILGGYHGQDFQGVTEDIPVDVYTYDSSPCVNCSRHSDHFYAYRKDSAEYSQALDKLRSITGLSPVSFQGLPKSDRFTIVSSPAVSVASAGKTENRADSVSGRRFIDEVVIGDVAIPLPEGDWQGLAHIQNPSSRGSDELAVLAKIEQDKLQEMVVLRLQFVVDGKGFARHSACDAAGAQAAKTAENQDFGKQMCFWVGHDTAPWGQPIFNLAANRLVAKNVALPDVLINSVFHRADKNSALTVVYANNPEIRGLSSPKTTWEASSWHPKFIQRFPDKLTYMQDRMQWAATWFQIFRAKLPASAG